MAQLEGARTHVTPIFLRRSSRCLASAADTRFYSDETTVSCELRRFRQVMMMTSYPAIAVLNVHRRRIVHSINL